MSVVVIRTFRIDIVQQSSGTADQQATEGPSSLQTTKVGCDLPFGCWCYSSSQRDENYGTDLQTCIGF
jgi:hypothetical protein